MDTFELPYKVAIVKMPDVPRPGAPILKNWKRMFAGREFEVRYTFEHGTHNFRDFYAPKIERIRRFDTKGNVTSKGPQYEAAVAEVHEATLEPHINQMVIEAEEILFIKPGDASELFTTHFRDIRVKLDKKDARLLVKESVIADVHEVSDPNYIVTFHVHAWFEDSPVIVDFDWNLEEDGMEEARYSPHSPPRLEKQVMWWSNELFNIVASHPEKDTMVKIYNREEDAAS